MDEYPAETDRYAYAHGDAETDGDAETHAYTYAQANRHGCGDLYDSHGRQPQRALCRQYFGKRRCGHIPEYAG